LKILKLISLSFLRYLGMIIFVVVLVLATLFTYFYLQDLIMLRGDYLLSVTSPINILAVVMIMLLITFKLIQLKDKLFSKKEESLQPVEYMDENQSYIIPIIIEEDSRFYIFLVKQVNYHYPKGIVASGRNTKSLSLPD